jgi:hypothetical protein
MALLYAPLVVSHALTHSFLCTSLGRNAGDVSSGTRTRREQEDLNAGSMRRMDAEKARIVALDETLCKAQRGKKWCVVVLHT